MQTRMSEMQEINTKLIKEKTNLQADYDSQLDNYKLL